MLDDFRAGLSKHWSGQGAVRKWGRFYDYLSESSYKQLIKAKVVIGKGAARQGTPGHFCGLENTHVCVSAQT